MSLARNDCCYLSIDPDSEAIAGRAEFSAWVTDGIELDWQDVDTAAYFIIVLIGGDDVSVDVDDFSLSSGTQDVTDPGFEPDAVIGISAGVAFGTGTTPSSNSFLCFGAAVNGGNQVCYSRFGDDGVSTTDSAMYVDTSNVYRNIDESASNETVSLGTYDSSGFTATYGGTGGTAYIAYLAISADSDFHVDTFTSNGSTGTQSITDPGFTPQFVLFQGTRLTVVDSHVSSVHASPLCHGFMDEDNNYVFTTWDHIGQSTTDVGSRHVNVALRGTDGAGNAAYDATFDSFDANGYTLDYSNGEARPVFALSFEEEATAITGTGAGSTSVPTGTGTGVLEFTATGAGSTEIPTGTGVGVLEFTATGAGSTDVPTGTGTGVLAFTATGAGSTDVATGTGVALLIFTATGAGSTEIPTGTGTGVNGFTGTGAGSTTPPTGTGTGVLEFTATGAGSTDPATGTGVALLIFTATGAGSTDVPTGAGVGVTANTSVAVRALRIHPLELALDFLSLSQPAQAALTFPLALVPVFLSSLVQVRAIRMSQRAPVSHY